MYLHDDSMLLVYEGVSPKCMYRQGLPFRGESSLPLKRTVTSTNFFLFLTFFRFLFSSFFVPHHFFFAIDGKSVTATRILPAGARNV